MSLWPKQLPERRLELGLAGLLVLLLSTMIAMSRDDTAGTQLVMFTLELILPPVMGLVSAGLLANDPALDLILSVPRPAPRILFQRLAIVLAYSAVLALVVQFLAGLLSIRLPVKDVGQALIWIGPFLLYTGLATAGALLRGRMLDGVGAVIAGWVTTLITISVITELCASSTTSTCLAAVASPAMSYFRSQDPNWPLNRVLWIVFGLALIGIGLYLASNEERLVEAARAPED